MSNQPQSGKPSPGQQTPGYPPPGYPPPGKTPPGKTPPGQTRERIYQFVRQRLLQGEPPTVREVQQEFGFRAVQTAHAHLQQLVREGRLIQRAAQHKSRARGFGLPWLTRDHPPALIPLLGRVQAGPLTTAVEDHEGTVSVQLRNPQELFALRVRGDSMVDAGIRPGDLAIVRVQSTADSGDVVVALVEDEATIKTLRRRRGRVELHPANANFEPIVPDPRAFSLLGKVIEIRHSLEA